LLITEKIDEWGKLTNVMQFHEVIEVLLMSTSNWPNLQFRGEIVYLLKLILQLQSAGKNYEVT